MEKLKHFQEIHESEVTEPRPVHLENKLICAGSIIINRTFLRKLNSNPPSYMSPLLYEASLS